MPRRRTQQSLVKPLIWEIHDGIPVPDGIDREGLLSMYRLKFGCLQFLKHKKNRASWTPEDNYVEAIIKEAEERWKKTKNPHDVVRLLDNFPRLLEPSIIPDFPWVLEALEAVFLNRQYGLFSDLDAALKAGGTHKTDVNIRTFREYHFVFRYLRQEKCIAWIRRENPILAKLLDDKDMEGVRKYRKEHKVLLPPAKILRGLRSQAKEFVCQEEQITEEAFRIRMKRAKKEPAVKQLIRTTAILGELDEILAVRESGLDEKPDSPKNREPKSPKKERA